MNLTMKDTDWDNEYQTNHHQERWDISTPSPELLGLLLALHLPPHTSCLDLGCGSGTEAIFLAQQGHEVVGVDWSEQALSLAQAKAQSAGVQVQWQRGNVLDLPIKDSSIFFALERGCFHHILPEQRPQFAAEVYRVLRPGGYFFMRDAAEALKTFTKISVEEIDGYFPAPQFSRSAVYPFVMWSDSGRLPAQMVLLQKQE